MADFRVEDTFAFHAKTLQAGNAALGLWVRAGAWSMQTLSDGFVPRNISRQIGTKAQADRLISSGLWTLSTRDGIPGYEFHEWEERQRSRDQVENEKAAARERAKRSREAKSAPARTPHVRRTSNSTYTAAAANVRDSLPFPSLPYIGTGGGVPYGEQGEPEPPHPHEPPPEDHHPDDVGSASAPDNDDTPPPGNLDPDNPRCEHHAHIPADDRGPNCLACRRVRQWCEQAPNRAATERARIAANARQATADCGHCDDAGWLLADDGTPVEPAIRCNHLVAQEAQHA